MRVQFVQRGGAPEKLICEAEILFDDGVLGGMKLVGFSLWRGGDDQVFVTFPARAFGSEGDRRLWRGPRYGEVAPCGQAALG
jgi:hypothetical protein